MQHGRRVKDEELLEVTGGIDAVSGVDPGATPDPARREGGGGGKFPPPGGSPDPEAPYHSGGDQDLGPND